MKEIKGIKEGIKLNSKIIKNILNDKQVERLIKTSKKIAYKKVSRINAFISKKEIEIDYSSYVEYEGIEGIENVESYQASYKNFLNRILTLQDKETLDDLTQDVLAVLLECKNFFIYKDKVIITKKALLLSCRAVDKVINRKNRDIRKEQSNEVLIENQKYLDITDLKSYKQFELNKNAIEYKYHLNYDMLVEKMELTNKQADILKLILSGLSFEQVAQIQGIHKSTVKTLYYRVLKKIKTFVGV